MVAGSGFQSYSWENAANPGVVLGTEQTLEVTQTGTYIVTRIAPVGCIGQTETIHVIGYDSEPNPIASFADQVLTCSNNGLELAEIYLCTGDDRTINLPFDPNSQTTVRWFQLDEASCADETQAGCPNVNTACTWNEIGNGEFSRDFADAGEFRLDVLYDGQCPRSYYFNVYKATVTPEIVVEEIICGAPGSITVNNIPSTYQYSLSGISGTATDGYFVDFQDSNVFSVTQAGDYNLTVRLNPSEPGASCNYTFDLIYVGARNIDLQVTGENMECANGPATIRAQINNVPGPYTYTLTLGGNTVGSQVGITDNNYEFTVTDGGNYTVTVSTPQCSATQDIEIIEPAELTLTALKTKDISCEDGSSPGIIELTAGGGTIDTSTGNSYYFAVWTSQGVDLYTNVSDIPASAYLTSGTNSYSYSVPIGSEGVYRFVVIDHNGCYQITGPIEVVIEPELQFSYTTTDISCNGLTNGEINVGVNGDNLGYAVEYSINNTDWFNPGAFSNLAAGSYTIYIRASKNSYQCLYEITNVTINEPEALSGGGAAATNLECNTSGGITYGTITFTPPTGGTGAYTYQYKLSTDSTYTVATTNPATGLPAGIYDVRVVDANGCPLDLDPVEIEGLPTAPTLRRSVDYNCDGTGNITITANPAGSYTYTLGTISNTTGVFTNIAPGAYTVSVDYGSNCTRNINVSVRNDRQLSGSIIGSSDSECFGSDNGSITISAQNIVGSIYEYSIDGGDKWSVTADNPYKIVGLAPDTYNVLIRETDGNASCELDLGSVTLSQPTEILLSASLTQEVTCNTTTSTITAEATGGIPPYTFSIDGGTTWQSSPVFENVPPRAEPYIVMVLDSRQCNECGCTANLFENGDFEDPTRANTTFRFINENDYPGWNIKNEDNDNLIEIWYNNFRGVPAYSGVAHAELNADAIGTMYQEFCTQPGDVINWSVAHRGRAGVDVATVNIGADLLTTDFMQTMTDGNTAWGVYSGQYIVPANQTTTIISFEAVSTATGNRTVGNFIDDVQITIARSSCIPVTVIVEEPEAIDFTLTPVTCYDGTNGTITVDVLSGNDDYQFSINGGAPQSPDTATPNTFTFTGLIDDTYDITVYDGRGCSETRSATILPQLSATVTTVGATCSDGQIVINPSGGDGSYQFIVEDAGGTQTTYPSSPIDVPAGTYTVYVRDKNGGANFCEFTDTVTVTQIPNPTISTSATQPNCSTDTGTITVTTGNGTAPYTVTVTGPTSSTQTGNDLSYSFTGLAGGNYTITVTDVNNCFSLNATEVITVPSTLTSGGPTTATDVTCSPSGTTLGTITFTPPTGGTTPYTYFYKLTTDATYTQVGGTTVTNLGAGTYDTRVVDANGCLLDLNQVTIADLPAAPALSTSVAYNCDGTGTITVTPLDASYEYTLDGTITQTGDNVFNNVAVGTHTISVEYGSGCATEVTVNVAPDQEFTAAVIGQTNPTCIGDTDGTITVEVYFPYNPPSDFEYNIGSGWELANSNPFTIPGFAEGMHNIQVRPTGVASVCDVSLPSVTLTDPTAITVVGLITKEITCNPATGATISPTASNGNGGPYTYELFDSTNTSVPTTSPFTDIPAGTYTVVATDRLGCTGSVTVTVDPILTVTFDAEPQCYDGSNGEIQVTNVTGNGNYQFNINGGPWQFPNAATPNEFTFTGLSATSYVIRVQDEKGCYAEETVTINPQLLAAADVTNASCSDGSIKINPIGGAGNYVYSIVSDGSPAGPFTALDSDTDTRPAGTYDVYVRDNNGVAPYCEYIIQDVVINPVTPVSINAIANHPVCSGDLGSVDGQIVVNTGQAPHTIVITDSSDAVVDTINNFSGSNFSFNNLVADSYLITIIDDLGCEDTFSFSLTDPVAIPMNIKPVLPEDCTTIVPANTGFDFNFGSTTLASFAPYTLWYTVDGTTWTDMSTLPFATSGGDNLYSVRGLTPGQVYYPAIRIMDGATVRCQVNNGIFVMPFQVSGIVVQVTPSGNCTTGYSVTVVAQNGVGPFEFGISTDDPINTNTWYPAIQPGPVDLDPGNPNSDFRRHIFTGIIPGLNYQFYVRDTDTGCIETNKNPIDYSTIDSDFDVNITSTVNNQSCYGANNGQIEFTIEDTDGVLSGDTIGWELYDGITDLPLGITGTIADTETYPYTFDVPPTETLNPGLYFIVIESTSGGTCQWASGDVEILEGSPITGNLNLLNNITCSVDGLIRVENVSGGFGGYTYTVISATNTTLATPITLTGTTFSVAHAEVSVPTLPVNVMVEVTDNNGCSETFGPVALNVSPSPVLEPGDISSSSCASTKTITITADNGAPLGGTPPYRYSNDNGATFTAPTSDTFYTFTALVPGNYDIVVRDANGCATNSIPIVIYPDVDFSLTPAQNLNCVPGQGVFNIEITSGANLGTAGDFTYSVTPVATSAPDNGSITGASTSQNITVTASGIYNVTVTDITSGCSNTKSITIQDPVQPNFTHTATASLCAGDNSGIIELNAVDNGILPLVYEITNTAGTYTVTLPAGDSVFTNLPPDIYSVTGRGANGCTTTLTNIEIEEYDPIVPSTPVVTEFLCTTGNTVNVASVELPSGTTGGSGNYTRVVFTYDPADGSPDENQDGSNFVFTTTNTAGGTVSIVVYDDQGCSETTAATIQPFNALSNPVVTLDNAITCTTGEDITVTYSSTTSVATNITIEGVNGHVYGPITQIGVTSGDFDALPTGDYQITIENPSTGCELVTYHTVAEEPVFDILITDIKDEGCQDGNDGSAVLIFSPSTPYTSGYTYTVYTSAGVDTGINGVGDGDTPQLITTGLSAGTYYVRIDMGGNSPFCQAQSDNFTIAEPTVPLSVVGTETTAVSCNGGSDATITATGSDGWGNYVYQLEETANPGVAYGGYAFSSNNIFINLPAGDYTVVVRDKGGAAGVYCEASDQVVIADPVPVTFTVDETDNVCDTSVGGSITVNAAGGTGTYTYTLSNSGGVVETQVLTATSYTFTNLAADVYTVNVVDSNNCDAGTPTDVTINPDVNFSLVETKKVDCSASPDGIVTVDLVNWVSGTSNYEYDVTGSVDAVLVSNVAITSDPFTITIPSTNDTPQTYTVTVRDLDATPICDVSRTIEIQPEIRPDFAATASVNDICFGSTDGEITVSPTDNGILPLTYTISPDPNDDSGISSNANVVFANLPAGVYTIEAEGINGCTTSTNVEIRGNDEIDIPDNAITVTQFACTEGNTTDVAVITVDRTAITGGTGNYIRAVFLDAAGTVLQDDSNFTYISTDIAGGTYTINVYDENNDCFGTATATINPFTPMTDAEVNVTKAIDCATGENITVKVQPDLANITYTITGSNTGYTDTQTVTLATDVAAFTGLPTDTYTIEISNTNTGCVFVTYHTVEEAPIFDVLATPERACYGGTGSVTINFGSETPYTGAYDYEVFAVGNPTAITSGSGTGGTPTPINNLIAGNYYVSVVMLDSPYCEPTTENFEIIQPVEDLIVNGEPTFINCNVSTSGEILLTAEGGWGNYQYELVNNTTSTTVQNFDSNRRITGLAAGSYTATVQDDNNCLATYEFTLNDPVDITANINVIENDCEGEYSASIEVTNVTGGQAQDNTISYTYILTYPDGVTQVEQSSNIFNNLPAGVNYQVTVRDNKYSCQFIDNVDIVDPTEVQATANIIEDITCNNSEATVEVFGAGGTGAYQYSSDGVNYSDINTFNVGAGEHTFYVRDENNCVKDVVVNVAAYEELEPTLNVESGFVTCNGDANGVLSATVVGGFGNYEYQLLDNNDVVVADWQESSMFGSLGVGTYKINVRSTNRFGVVCFAETATYNIQEPEPLVVDENHTDVSCYGGSDGTITVLASGGNLTGYEYNISSDPTNKFVLDNVFRNLSAGNYTITVKDKLGCLETIDVTIGEPDEFTATLVSTTEQICINDPSPTITIEVEGGTQPYYVSINNIEMPTPYNQNTIVLGAAENIQGGMPYYITVRDSGQGCDIPEPIRLTTAEPVDLQLTVDYEYTCPTGNIILAMVDEVYRNNVSYTLFDGTGNSVATNTTGEFIDVPAGNGYIVTVTHTITSCSESSSSNPIDIIAYQPLVLTIDDSVKNTLIANAEFGLPPYEYSVDGSEFGPDNEFLILQTKDYTITVRDARGCEVTLTVRGEYISIFIPNLFTPDGDGTNDYWYPREVEDYHEIKVFIYDRYARNLANFKGVVEGWDGNYDGKPLPSGDYWYTIYFKELSGQEKKVMGHFTLYR
ncbi:T9SS type B sorting domain-containing protein [Tenacibaculum tangerinum]|uniref:T9SS type B sorting domain-containing protein n=1 Tax=Tenacibaculum tangerinum TaxID=3038772 RepID=A0ABY8L6Q8_9FLAO|nr:T9SS type B sorting domain-containing protein [Tenacibaculum tangerinum]WGH75883.1 T9SS type B sorting domain-containing protein [Tenacibaculum tangerinum]